MIHTIRTSKFSKIIASYLAIQLILTTIQPSNLFALTGGPSQPEFNSFTPIGTSDMVNLSSGDFNYNIPIMDVGGYPLNLAYNSGITMDQEASWVGLGWNLNVGQIARNVRGIPDDFKGDEIRYENELKKNVTIGTALSVPVSIFGVDALQASIGLGVEYNNYNGFTYKPSLGLSYGLNDANAAVGLNISSATGEGATITPSVSLTRKGKETEKHYINNITTGFGLGLNSRQGVTNLNLSFSNKRQKQNYLNLDIGGVKSSHKTDITDVSNNGAGGSISFNDLTNYTPTKRVAMYNDSKTFALSGGFTAFSLSLQGQVSAYGSYQEIKESEKDKYIKSFGYENTEFAEGVDGILDFNREKDNVVNKFTTMLPVTNYSYDVYSIQGQGTGGTFRPFRSQVSYVYDNPVSDSGMGATFGFEVAGGNLAYAGAEINITTTTNKTGKWDTNNYALKNFKEKSSDLNPIDYEKVYFKSMGELIVDNEINIYNDLQTDHPIRLEVAGNKYNRSLRSKFKVKDVTEDKIITGVTKRAQREKRNHTIHKISQSEASLDTFVDTHPNAKGHHTVGIKTIKPDGSTYVFGKAAYNTTKIEASFDVSGSNDADCQTGLIGYNGNVNGNNSSRSNKYLNKITTPSYAHTYMLSSVLSSDYEDLSLDGPTDDDLGAYTKFNYDERVDNYKWRVPYQENKAIYNEGLKSNEEDQVGNYIYGEKELRYISSIETKTHVAVFQLADRHDAIGVKGETGGRDASSAKMKKIEKIFLYSKPEYKTLTENTLFKDLNYVDKAKAAIKIAHFEYNYSLCPDMINNDGQPYDTDLTDNINSNDNLNKGKLTLKKVYFTYRGSNMGKYTPYKFNYEGFDNIDGETIIEANAGYNLKAHDIWGNYKEVTEGINCSVSSDITNAEFPFVEQDQTKADLNTRMWTLTSIDLPSGGRLELETESDDYQYVQDRETMSMLKVSGSGNDPSTDSYTSTELYRGVNRHNKYLYVKLPEVTTRDEFLNNYIGDQIDKAIYFRFLLNLSAGNDEAYDYVSGYFEIDDALLSTLYSNNQLVVNEGVNYYGVIPLKTLDKEGGFVSNNKQVNPIAKAGWHFGRTYLNRLVYEGDQYTDVNNFGDVAEGIWDAIKNLKEIFTGPNLRLEQNECAKNFNPDKSWIRLKHANKVKLGGGLRVKRIVLKDNWELMTENESSEDVNLYKQHYGQEYDYTKDGLSSGVATFEPNGSKENPLVEPFYSKLEATKYADRMVSPNENNYVEKPIGETFYPSPTVTYGTVTVRNLERKNLDQNLVVNKHATGKVVNEFFTSRNFPTISDYTQTNGNGLDEAPKILGLFNLSTRNHITLSQGFSIITNDMNGKQKSQRVYGEGQSEAISGVDYFYNVDENNPNKLDNTFTTIDKDGTVGERLIGQTYDVVNDFRENYSSTKMAGVNSNVTTFLAAIIPAIVPFPLPTYAQHENILRTAVTTKVIHKTGVLKEKIAYDIGAQVSTENLAWDAQTGQVLLTKTVNEYDDNYYNLTYPAHWYYEGMGQASKNLGAEGLLKHDVDGDSNFYLARKETPNENINTNLLFSPGDVLQTYHNDGLDSDSELLWVAEVGSNTIKLMNKEGFIINDECTEHLKPDLIFKIIRSGYKNLQSASMASVTCQENPIVNNSIAINNSKVINASAVMYNEYWKPQDQLGLPRLTPSISTQYDKAFDNDIDSKPLIENANSYGFNPYLYNARGEWRAIESYAYLIGRTSNISNTETNPNLKEDGYFSTFNPFYKKNGSQWEIDANVDDDWTSASTVTHYSPYGAELENKDALGRYSSAIYGYAYTLPTAVASNNRYSEIAFDSFEDADYNGVLNETSALIDDVNFVTDEINYFTRDHFSFNTLTEDTVGNGEVSAEESHTGTQSYKVTGNQVRVTKDLTELEHEFTSLCLDEEELPNLKGLDTNLTQTDSIGDFHDSYENKSYDSNGHLIRNTSSMSGYVDRKFLIQISADDIEDLATMDRTFLFVTVKHDLDFPICGDDNWPQYNDANPDEPHNLNEDLDGDGVVDGDYDIIPGHDNWINAVISLKDKDSQNSYPGSPFNFGFLCSVYHETIVPENYMDEEHGSGQLIELTFPDAPINDQNLLMEIEVGLYIDYALQADLKGDEKELKFDSTVQFRLLDEYGRQQGGSGLDNVDIKVVDIKVYADDDDTEITVTPQL